MRKTFTNSMFAHTHKAKKRDRKEIIIGLTYDLRDDYLQEGYSPEETAEFDRSDTIQAIENVIREQGFITDRIGHVKALTLRLAGGDR